MTLCSAGRGTLKKNLEIKDFLQYKILYKKQNEGSKKKIQNCRPDILKQKEFFMSPHFDESLEDFKEYM